MSEHNLSSDLLPGSMMYYIEKDRISGCAVNIRRVNTNPEPFVRIQLISSVAILKVSFEYFRTHAMVTNIRHSLERHDLTSCQMLAFMNLPFIIQLII